MTKKILLLTAIIIPCALVLFYYASVNGQTRSRLTFSDSLYEVATTVDGEDITLSDLRFYILFQEHKVEEQAKIYNSDNTKDYWNTHTNGKFLQTEVKEAIIGMAIHDYIMYNQAREEHIVMGPAEKEALENARTRFWEELYDEQLIKLPYSYEEGNQKILEITLGEIYQQRLCKEMNTSYAGLNWNGYDFEQLLKEHEVTINDKVWDRVIIGDISLSHDRVSYINGLTDEDLERIRENKKK